MFSKIGFASTAILLLLGLAICQFQVKLRPADRMHFARLSEKPASLTSLSEFETELGPKETVQERSGVKKEIWTVKNGQRTLFSLTSKQSVLTLKPSRNTFEISEQLTGVTCLLQEEISLVNNKIMQEVRTLSADRGTYLFPKHQFTSDAVDIHFFRLLGDTIPTYPLTTTPYLSGQASDVTFSASDRSLQFTASYLKANLDPKQVFYEDR